MIHLELHDLVAMEASADYKERFKAEYLQLAIRYNKLKDMVYKWDKAGVEFLGFVPTCPRSTFSLQLRVMADYLAILEARAVMEGIDLSEYLDYQIAKENII